MKVVILASGKLKTKNVTLKRPTSKISLIGRLLHIVDFADMYLIEFVRVEQRLFPVSAILGGPDQFPVTYVMKLGPLIL